MTTTCSAKPGRGMTRVAGQFIGWDKTHGYELTRCPGRGMTRVASRFNGWDKTHGYEPTRCPGRGMTRVASQFIGWDKTHGYEPTRCPGRGMTRVASRFNGWNGDVWAGGVPLGTRPDVAPRWGACTDGGHGCPAIEMAGYPYPTPNGVTAKQKLTAN